MSEYTLLLAVTLARAKHRKNIVACKAYKADQAGGLGVVDRKSGTGISLFLRLLY